MAKSLLALVQWIGGVDDGLYSTDIPVEWIKDFDYDDFLENNADDEESYVIEWHDTKKPPKGGWKCYDARVIQVSDKKTVLQRALKALHGVLSPNFDLKKNSEQTEMTKNSKSYHPKGTKSAGIAEKIKKKGHPMENLKQSHLNPKREERRKPGNPEDDDSPDLFSDSDVNDDHSDEDDIDETPVFKMPKQKKHLNLSVKEGGSVPLKPRNESENNKRRNEDSDKPNKKFKDSYGSGIAVASQSSTNANFPTYDERYLAMSPNPMAAVLNAVHGMQQQMSKLIEKNNVDEESTDDRQVEIGHKGSGCFIRQTQWKTAVEKPTPTLMATFLVDSIFPVSVLLASNLRGGKSKVPPKDPNKPQQNLKALDKDILKAIYEAVQMKHPKKYNFAMVGKAISCHLQYLRDQKTLNDERGKENRALRT